MTNFNAGLLGVALLLAMGCQNEHPLVEKAELAIDPTLVGTWIGINEDPAEDAEEFVMVVMPFSANEYVVVYGTDGSGLYFRAYRGTVAGVPMMQMQWLGHGDETTSKSDDPFVACRYTLDGDTLTVALPNNKVLLPGTTAEMAARFEANTANPELFGEAVTFTRRTGS